MEAFILLTLSCNFDCKHCFLPDDLRKRKVSMSIDEFSVVLDKVEEIKKMVNEPEMLLILSGGEPLILGAKKLETYLKVIRSRFGENVRINVNTNLFFYNDRFGKIFQEYNVEVDASYDPYDVRFSDSKTEQRWKRNFHRVVETGVDVKIALTLTRRALKFDLLEFAREMGTAQYMMSHFCPIGSGWKNKDNLYVTKKEVAFYIMGLLYFQDLLKPLSIHPWKDLPHSYHQARIGSGVVDCWGPCYNCFAFTPGGGVYLSGFCYSSSPLGNIYSDTIAEILASDERISFMQWKLTRPECLECEHHFFCRGGCFSLAKVEEDKSTCPGLKPLMDFLSTGIIPGDIKGEFLEFLRNSTWMGKYLW